jgi:hypothetical protein
LERDGDFASTTPHHGPSHRPTIELPLPSSRNSAHLDGKPLAHRTSMADDRATVAFHALQRW